MTYPIALLVVLTTVNPLRIWPGFPGATSGRRFGLFTVGAMLSLAATLGLATLSAPILDFLEISAATARIAAGVAVVAIGGRDLLTGSAQPDPALPGWAAALVPVAIPHLFGPGLALLAISGGSDLGVVGIAAVVAAALSASSVLALAPRPANACARAVLAGQRLSGAVAILMGAALVSLGIFDF